MSEDKLYRSPAVNTPSVETLQGISKDLGFDITDRQMEQYQGVLEEWLGDCGEVDSLPEPSLPVKYPRTPGHRPPPEENTHNAWYYKTCIRGASDGILAGKKVAVKDTVAVAGVPMMVGSRLMEGYIPEFDATIVTRILDAGGELVGKTVCEDLCFSGGSSTAATGPVLHPMNKDNSAGGSSSGSAVVVALGEADMSIGGDQGGSIRTPASYCGLVGLKPTFGLVPYTGVLGMDTSVDTVGPMTRSVKDCALLLQAIAGYDDGLDPRQYPHTKGLAYSELLTGDIRGVKIGLVTEGFTPCDDDVQSVVRQAVMKYLSAATIEDVSVPLHSKGNPIWSAYCIQGAYMNTAGHGGFGIGHRGFYPTSMMEHMWRGLLTRPNDLPFNMKSLCLYGAYMGKTNGPKYYAKAGNMTRLLQKAYDDVLAKYNVLIMPTRPCTAPTLPTFNEMANFKEYKKGGINCNLAPANLTGHPALTINAGFLDQLPVGLMIVGKYFDEVSILNVAQAIESGMNDL